jgi:hypothetical protein
MISSLMPMTFLLLPLDPPEPLLFLFVFDVFEELGDEVDALFVAEFALEALLLLALLLLLLELLLLPELEDPEDPPEDCFSFLSLIIISIYTLADHLFMNLFLCFTLSQKIENFLLHFKSLFFFFSYTISRVSQKSHHPIKCSFISRQS